MDHAPKSQVNGIRTKHRPKQGTRTTLSTRMFCSQTQMKWNPQNRVENKRKMMAVLFENAKIIGKSDKNRKTIEEESEINEMIKRLKSEGFVFQTCL